LNDEVKQILSAAYQSSYRTMRVALLACETTEDRLATYAAQMTELDGTINGFTQITETKVACAKGCAFCCSLQIDVRAHETLLIARHLQRSWEADKLETLTDRLRNQKPGQPCSLLDWESLCSIYQYRPAACRRYLSVSVEACEELSRKGETFRELEPAMVAEGGRHAAMGMHNAYLREGYDGFSYDLARSLVEALDDHSSFDRWEAHEKVFSKAAESEVPEGFSQADAIAKLRERLVAEDA